MTRAGKRGLEDQDPLTGDNVEVPRLKKRLINEDGGETRIILVAAAIQAHRPQ